MPSRGLFGALRAFRPLRSAALLVALVTGAALSQPVTAQAASPFLVVPDASEAEQSPAFRYANMTDDEAFAELDRRQVLYSREGATHGVRAPIRLTGRLHGVYFHSSLPVEERQTTMFEILDARLALAIDDFAAVLERHDIDEVVHYTMYRPNVPRPAQGGHRHDEGDEAAAPRPKRSPRHRHASPARPRASAGEKAPPAAPAVAKAPDAKAPVAAAKAPDAKAERAPEAKAPGASADAKPAGAKATEERKAKPRKADATKGADKLPRLPKGSANDRPAGAKQKKNGAAKPELPPAAKNAAPKRGGAKHTAAGPARRDTPVAKRETAKRATSVEPASPPAETKPAGTWAPPGTRHPAGLAIDVGMLHKRSGEWLSVAGQFQGNIGDKTCGDGVRLADTPGARELRAIVCESADLGIFTYVLTPNFNVAHADHFHMEIKPGVRWFLYH